jgi:hypothetical protein
MLLRLLPIRVFDGAFANRPYTPRGQPGAAD